MHELEFVREKMLQEAWEDVQWNFLEDVERETERQITHFLNKVLRIEADRRWVEEYNTGRPHEELSWNTPSQWRERHEQAASLSRNQGYGTTLIDGKAIAEEKRIAARSDRQSPEQGTCPIKYQLLHRGTVHMLALSTFGAPQVTFYFICASKSSIIAS